MTAKQRPTATEVDADSSTAGAAVAWAESVRAYLSFLADPSSAVDAREVARLEKLVTSSTDPLDRLRHTAALHRATTPGGEHLLELFIRDAKKWAEAESVPASAFLSTGVSNEVLRKAGLLKATRRTNASRPAKRVTVEDVKSWVLSQESTFTVKDVSTTLGGAMGTVTKALQELLADELIVNTGPDDAHQGPGRAPARFEVIRNRRSKA
jgi:hypothetical protein